MTKEDELAASRRYSANVRAEVARAGRTQTDVARAVGMNWSVWQRRVGGQVSWRVAELESIARELGVRLSVLTGNEQ